MLLTSNSWLWSAVGGSDKSKEQSSLVCQWVLFVGKLLFQLLIWATQLHFHRLKLQTKLLVEFEFFSCAWLSTLYDYLLPNLLWKWNLIFCDIRLSEVVQTLLAIAVESRGRHNFWKTWSDRTWSDWKFLKPDRIELDRIDNFKNLIGSKISKTWSDRTWSDRRFEKPDRIGSKKSRSDQVMSAPDIHYI